MRQAIARLGACRVGRDFEAHRSAIVVAPVGLEDSTHPTKPVARRRARRAVLVAVGVFLAAQFGLNVAVDTVRPHWRDPEWGWRADALRTPDPRPLVLALGTSRTQMGLNPAAVGCDDLRVFNYGQAGAEPRQLWRNYHRVRSLGIRPAALLIEIMPATLAAGDRVREPLSRLSAADCARQAPHAADPVGFRREWVGSRLNPWAAYRSNLLSHAAPGLLSWRQRVDFQWKTMSPDGWVPYLYENLSPADRARLTAPVHAQYAETLADLHVHPASDRAVRELISDAQSDGVRVVLYRMPEGPTFRGWYGPGANDRVTRYLATLGVPVIDATDWLPDEAFGDGHHPTRSGAAACSRRFGRDHLGPWLDRLH